MKPKAVVAVSGGMDSCVAAAIAARMHELYFLHILYGQRTEEREKKAFNDIARHYRIPPGRKLIVPAPHFPRIGGSSLTDRSLAIPTPNSAPRGVPSTYVPFRNAFIISVAVGWAEAAGAEKVFMGLTEPDSAGYPDCRPSFVEAFNRTIEAGTRPETHIRLEAPLIALRKTEIVSRGKALGVPFHLTWSCYASTGPLACGRCESCRLRLKGFREAGLEDPLRYA